MNLNIIKTHGKASIWPGKDNAMLVTCIDSNGKKYQATIPIAEYRLSRMVQQMMSYVPERDIMQLKDLIEEYGQEEYEKGADGQAPSC